MTQESIKQTINALKAETADFKPQSFKEKLYCAYRTKLLSDLQACKSAEEYKIVLANNWSQVKGNALCYTARPDDPLTELLCEIAEDISKELQINELTKVDKLKVAPICLLMPRVVTESIYSENDSAYTNYPNLTDLLLNKILQTHILSDSGRYLIPVRTLLELPGPWEDDTKPLRIYYDDFTENPKQHFVTESELNRLRKHTVHTEALFTAKEDYEALVKNSGLLGHLQTLIRALKTNSTSGIGAEAVVGQGTYAALEHFTQYYQSLGAIAQQIPNDLKSSLDELIAIASEPVKYKAATVSQLCINMRHQALSNLVEKHENALMCIGVDSVQKAQLLSNAQKRFEGNKESLSKLLIHDQLIYAGQDALGLNQALLDAFKILPEITSLRSLQDFLSLSPGEIKQITADNASVQAGILQQFPNLEAFVLFCLTTPLEPLSAIISTMGEQLSGKLIHSFQDINNCLVLMEGSRLELMMQLLAARLPIHINSADNFRKVLQNLSSEQRTIVYQAFKAQLPTLIKNANDFCNALEYLNGDQRNAVYEACKAKLLSLIGDRYSFYQVFQYLSLEQRSALYNAFKPKIPAIINNWIDLSQILRFLNAQQCAEVCEVFKAVCPPIIKYVSDLALLQSLNAEQFGVVFGVFKEHLANLVKDGRDFRDMLEYLNLEQRNIVYKAFKEKLLIIIKSSENFQDVILHLSCEQCTEVCEALKVQLPTIITNGYDFGKAINKLSPEQFATVIATFKPMLPTIIKNLHEIIMAFTHIMPKQYATVCEELKEQLQTIIKEPHEFQTVLAWLNPNECIAFCNALQAQLLSVIKSAKDFEQVLESLIYQKRAVVYEALKMQLPRVINSCDEFSCTAGLLTFSQRIEVFNLLKAKLRAKIEQGVDLNNLPDWLASDECLKVLGCSADEKQALQADIRALLESAKEKRDKTFCPSFETRKRGFSDMQATDENNEQNRQLDESNSNKVKRLQ